MLMAPLVAVTAIAADIGLAYAKHGLLQQTADSAALAGALAYSKTSSTAALQATVQDVVLANGWASSVIQSPSSEYLASSPQNSGNAAVRVILVSPVPVSFGAGILKATSLSLKVSSLVEIKSGAAACILSLSTLMVNSTISANGCSVAANTSITVNSGGSLTGKTVSAGTTITNNGTISGTQTTGSTVTDPYSSLSSAASAGFTSCTAISGNTQTLSKAGCYSGVLNSGTLTLSAAGTYFFSNFNMNGGTIVGTGVTLVFNSQFSPSNATFTITAPQSGTWDGMAMYLMGGMNLNSGDIYNVSGAIYSPTTALYLNSATWNANACTYVVAQSITANSGANLTLPQNCSSYSFTAPSLGGASGVVLTQ